MDGSFVLLMCCAVFTTLWRASVLRAVQLPTGGDAASQDTLNCAPVEDEDSEVHAEPPRHAEEEESRWVCDGVGVQVRSLLM